MSAKRVLVLAAIGLASAGAACMPPSWGANALLHPTRRPVGPAPTLPHHDLAVEGDGVTLRGWAFPPAAGVAPRGATVVYLHGVADNRASGTWIAEALVRDGFEVVTFDARAHG